MVTLHVHRFAILSRYGDQELGQAVVCADIEYAATLWAVTGRLERCSGSANLWQSLKQELAAGVGLGRMPQLSAVSLLLAGPRYPAVQIDYLGRVAVETPEHDPPGWFDRRLFRGGLV